MIEHTESGPRAWNAEQWPRKVLGGSLRGWSVSSRALVVAVAACAALAGCASASDVVATGKPNTYSVAASAPGGRMAWARAHEEAVNEAREYCERRGMQSSVIEETVSGVQPMSTHASSVNFECHPKF